MNDTAPVETGQEQTVANSIDVGGYSAIVNPFLIDGGASIGDASYDTNDGVSLEKLQHSGLDVDSLEDAYNRYKVAPIRTKEDLWRILGYTGSPASSVTDAQVTALAFLFPIPHMTGEVYPFTDYIRLRPRSPIHIKGSGGKNSEDKFWKYLQPSKAHTSTHSEPYFLCCKDTWTRVMSDQFPLFITEGECKAIALGLTGVAGIGFPGAQMMFADKKQGKNKLHPSLDPDGSRKGKTIPVRDRDIYIIPDSDFIDNKDVRLAFKSLVRNLVLVGADPNRIKIIQVPQADALFSKTGIDDYFIDKLGPRWGGDPDKVAEAKSLLDELVNVSRHVSNNEFIYSATSHIRGADRFIARFEQPDKFLGIVQASDSTRHSLWAMYNCDHYMLYPINLPLNNTSTKMAFKDDALSRIAHEVWDEGVRLAAMEEDVDGKSAAEMNADYPNRVFGLVQPYLPSRYNETLIEPFEGVEMGDHCMRIKGGLINITKCFKTGVDWDRRLEWLLPPNYRWFGTGQVNVSLSNLPERPQCPRFMALLDNMFNGDKESIECLQMSFGKILLAPMFLGHGKFLAFYGMAGSGKSTITNILIKLLGQHDVAALRSTLGGRFDTSELPGKRLILFPENEDGSDHFFSPEMATMIKTVTGRDMVVTEKKGQQPVSTRVDAEILIVGNAPPSMQMDEEAFRRRAVFLQAFNKVAVPDFGVSRTYMETVELAGILLWALEGAAKLAAGANYTSPAICQEDLDFAVMNTSSEKRFIMQMVVEKEGKKLLMSDIEDAFRSWQRHMRLAVKEPGWGKLSAAIRDKFGDKYKGEPTKDALRRSTRAYKGLALAEMLF